MADTKRLRVWHIPQVPGKAFRANVGSIEQAICVLDVLADYDAFQLKHRIKPDYSNAQGVETLEDGEWVEWYDDDGYCIDEYREKMRTPAESSSP